VKRALIIAAILAGCGSSGSGSAPDGGVAPVLVDAGPFMYQTCPPETRTGAFIISLESGFTAVSGKIASAVNPMLVPQLLQDAGTCRLVARRNLFCDPMCAAGTVCGDGGKCLPEPLPRDAGAVSIAGLSAPVMMTPSPQTRQYSYNKLPHPGFTPGAEIQLRASGAEVPAFFLRGQGITPLDFTTTGTVLEHGKDLVLQWTAGPAGPARIALDLQIDQHGKTAATLSCEVADTGTTTIPAALIDQLVTLGAAGFPTIRVTRRTVDAAMLSGGCVELQVTSTVERTIKVSGHDPCRTDADCPAGKTCAIAVETCH
jgi:hypothetical protein